MSLKQKIENQLSVALKDKQKNEITTLRLILASIKNKEIAMRGSNNKQEMKDSDIFNILKKMLKQCKESAEAYQKGGREDLYTSEMAEIKIIEAFLPSQLSEQQIRAICENIIKSIGAKSLKDMGKIMSTLKTKHAQEIDFSKAGAILKDLLK